MASEALTFAPLVSNAARNSERTVAAAPPRHHHGTRWLKSAVVAADCLPLLSAGPRDASTPRRTAFVANHEHTATEKACRYSGAVSSCECSSAGPPPHPHPTSSAKTAAASSSV